MARTLNLNTNSDGLLQQQAQWNHNAEQAHWDALAQRNAKANALNAQLEQRQQSMLDGSYNDNLLFAANDRAKARKNAEMETPLYKAEQLIANLQSAGRAMQDAQTTQGYTYNGLDAYQKPDGSYFVRDAQGNDAIVPKEQLQPKTSIDSGQALLSMLQAGNSQALAMFGATQDKESGKLSFAEQLALKQAEGNTKQAQWEAKQQAREAASDDKMTGYSKAKDIVGNLSPWFGDNEYATNEATNIVGQALVDPRYKKADVINAANKAKAASSQWYKGKTDFDAQEFIRQLTGN